MEINNNFQNGSKSTRIELLGKIYLGKATTEDINTYKKIYMTAEEKEIGKPVFEMNEEESLQFKVLSYNNSLGELPDYDCKICKNKGDLLMIDTETDCEVYKPCSCRNIRKTIKRMKECGMGNLLTLYRFSTFEVKEKWQKDIFDKATAFVNNDKAKWFCMLGQSGCGKSHICTAITRELLKMGMNVKYMMWLEESTRIKQAITNAELYARLVKELKEAEVLYIDDFFKNDNDTKPSPADIKLANEIINFRYNQARITNKRLVTLISCERTLEQLLEYDTALAGRIVEMTKPNNLIIVEGFDKNYRLK